MDGNHDTSKRHQRRRLRARRAAGLWRQLGIRRTRNSSQKCETRRGGRARTRAGTRRLHRRAGRCSGNSGGRGGSPGSQESGWPPPYNSERDRGKHRPWPGLGRRRRPPEQQDPATYGGGAPVPGRQHLERIVAAPARDGDAAEPDMRAADRPGRPSRASAPASSRTPAEAVWRRLGWPSRDESRGRGSRLATRLK